LNTYKPGQGIRLTNSVTVLGVLTDDASISLEIEPPGGPPVIYGSPVHDATGEYHQDVTAALPAGVWLYRWQTTNYPGIIEGQFLVEALSF
jgi:hypothetical protein